MLPSWSYDELFEITTKCNLYQPHSSCSHSIKSVITSQIIKNINKNYTNVARTSWLIYCSSDSSNQRFSEQEHKIWLLCSQLILNARDFENQDQKSQIRQKKMEEKIFLKKNINQSTLSEKCCLHSHYSNPRGFHLIFMFKISWLNVKLELEIICYHRLTHSWYSCELQAGGVHV